jgi:glycosyltransferase involved in cell wall biosynthesis
MSKQTVLVDIRETNYLKSGGKAVYNLYLTQELIKHKDFNWILITDQKSEHFTESDNVKIEMIPTKGLLWHLKVRKFVIKNSPDKFLAMTSYLTPYLIRNEPIKTFVFIHDLICFLFPEGHSFKAKFIESFCLPKIIDSITGIFTVSKNTQQDLKLLFPHLDNSKLKQAPCGYTVNSSLAKTDPIHKKNYILSVSTIIPRKNFEILIKAFAKLKDDYDLDLIIIGNPNQKAYFAKLQALVTSLKLESRVHFEGFVSQAELRNFYTFADAFVYPSKYEGFGIPLLEAMSYNCPVVASSSSSLPEVGQDAALYFDPNNEQELATVLTELLENPELKTQLNLKAQLILNTYSWQKTATKVIQAIQKA